MLGGWRDAWAGWREAIGRRPLVYGLAAAALLAVIATAALRVANPGMVPLFTDLAPGDATSIVAKLKADRIPYRLAGDGGTIMVPASHVHQLRLTFAQAGMPTGGVVGYEIFDKQNFTATESDRKVRLAQAISGELTRTIQQISSVQAARVQVTLPEEGIFVGQGRPAKAAVLLKLKPGVSTLDRAQVAGIRQLVAGSVPGLDPANVVVVDTMGRLLSSSLGDPQMTAAAGEQFELARQFEQALERDLKALLEQVLGPGNAAVKVQARLDFDRRETQRYAVDASGQIARSVQQFEETFSGSGTGGAGGVPGLSGNTPGGSLPTYRATGNGSSPQTYARKESTANYEVPQIYERMVSAPGAVERLSVAVVVNRELSAQQTEAIQQVVSAATGLDTRRGDVLLVTGMPFDQTFAGAFKEQWASEQRVRRTTLIAAVSAGALLALVGLAALMVVSRRRPRSAPAVATAAASAATGTVVSPRPPGTGYAAVQRSRSREELVQLARQKPEMVAQLLRGWMAEN